MVRSLLHAALTRRERVLVVLFLLLWPLALWAVTRTRPPWGDEVHFLAAVRFFGNGVSLDSLR